MKDKAVSHRLEMFNGWNPVAQYGKLYYSHPNESMEIRLIISSISSINSNKPTVVVTYRTKVSQTRVCPFESMGLMEELIHQIPTDSLGLL